MGTWGPGPFDNDAAGDFLAMYDEADQPGRDEMLRGLLEMVASNNGFLGYDDAAAAVAAASLVASSGPAPIAPLAVAALDRVITGDSEWLDLWAGSAQLDQATRELAAIRTALTS